MNIYSKKKRDIFSQLEVVNGQISELEKQRGLHQRKLHPIYNRPDLVKRGVAVLEKELETTTKSKAAEKRLIADIDKVKNSEPVFDKIDEINERIQQLKDSKGGISAELPEIREICNRIKAEIDKVKAV